MALQKRVWRILKANKGPYIGIVILILLGSFYFIAATGVSNNIEKMVVGFARQNRQEDLTFSTDRPIADIAAMEGESGAQIDFFPCVRAVFVFDPHDFMDRSVDALFVFGSNHDPGAGEQLF